MHTQYTHIHTDVLCSVSISSRSSELQRVPCWEGNSESQRLRLCQESQSSCHLPSDSYDGVRVTCVHSIMCTDCMYSTYVRTYVRAYIHNIRTYVRADVHTYPCYLGYVSLLFSRSLVSPNTTISFRVGKPPFRTVSKNITFNNRFLSPIVIYDVKLPMRKDVTDHFTVSLVLYVRTYVCIVCDVYVHAYISCTQPHLYCTYL